MSISYGHGVLWLINGVEKNGWLRQLIMQLLNSLQSLTRGQGQCSRKFLTFIVYMATLVRVNSFLLAIIFEVKFFFLKISVVLNCLQHSIFTIYHIYIFQLDNILLTVIGKISMVIDRPPALSLK